MEKERGIEENKQTTRQRARAAKTNTETDRETVTERQRKGVNELKTERPTNRKEKDRVQTGTQ